MATADRGGAETAIRRSAVPVATALLTMALALRVWHLETLPGINGDEAWYGVQMLNLMDGQPVEWRTPPGNLLNPFFSGLVLLMQLPFAPHFWILRAPAVISTVLAVVACAVLWRRFLSTSLTWVATLLLATLPVTIAYGRFGWDSSQSVLTAVLLIHALMKRRWALAGLCFVIGVWVHPTNIFLAPLVFIHLAYERPFDVKRFAMKSAGALVVVFAARYFFVPSNVQMAASSILERLLSADAWSTFVVRFGRLFSGVTSYTYIVGPLSPANQYAHDAIFWLLAISVTALGLRGAFRAADATRQAHVVGWVMMVAAFFALAGPEAAAPHFERYALVLVAPTVLTFVLLLGYSAEQLKAPRCVVAFGSVLAAICLVSFHANYVRVLATTGGESHRTFRTSALEPKASALDWIRQRSAGRADCAETRILAEDWWTFWPLRYLAYREPGLAVAMASNGMAEQWLHSMDGCRYLVGFVGGPFESLISQIAVPLGREAINDPLHRPILWVWTNP
jgi:hypothetical protein